MPGLTTFVSTKRELEKAASRSAKAAFLDADALSQAHPFILPLPVVGVVGDDIAAAVTVLGTYPWLSHVVGVGLLDNPLAASHMRGLLEALSQKGDDLSVFLPGEVKGRTARLVFSEGRSTRVERVGQYLEHHQVGPRTVGLLRDVAEELLTNAFYDAPVAGGFVTTPISRTYAVRLPAVRSCEIAYGVRGSDLAFVRVQDRFGSLTRDRLISVLQRCARSDMAVSIDESMGGAGLGLWRIFSSATVVAISVSPTNRCDILVGVQQRALQRKARGGAPPPFAVHLFFDAPPEQEPKDVDPLTDDSVLEHSVTLRF
jgi:hypothetical protein